MNGFMAVNLIPMKLLIQKEIFHFKLIIYCTLLIMTKLTSASSSLLHDCFLIGLRFDPEETGDKFLRK
jgi:hypothetical protein